MKRYLIFITFMCAGVALVNAQVQQVLTVEQCRSLALEHNKQIAAAKAQTTAAQYQVKAAKANFFPNFKASALGLYSTASMNYSSGSGQLPIFSIGTNGQPTQTPQFAYFPGMKLDLDINGIFTGGVQLEQPLYMGGKIRTGYSMAKLAQEMATQQVQLTSEQVIVSTDKAYAMVVKAKEMNKVAIKYNEVIEELLRNVESAHRHGLKSGNDILKVKVKQGESLLAIRRTENALKLAQMALCHLIGQPLDADITTQETFPSISDIPIDETLGIGSRTEYSLLEKKEQLAQKQVALLRSDMLPQVGIAGGYNYTYGVELNNETLLDKGSFMGLIKVSVPLFHFGEHANKVKAAQATLEQTRQERENLNSEMMLELKQCLNNLDEAKLQVSIAQKSLKWAEENMRTSGQQYNLGLETLANLLQAQAQWQQAYEAQVEAQYQLYLAQVSYKKASGTLLM